MGAHGSDMGRHPRHKAHSAPCPRAPAALGHRMHPSNHNHNHNPQFQPQPQSQSTNHNQNQTQPQPQPHDHNHAQGRVLAVTGASPCGAPDVGWGCGPLSHRARGMFSSRLAARAKVRVAVFACIVVGCSAAAWRHVPRCVRPHSLALLLMAREENKHCTWLGVVRQSAVWALRLRRSAAAFGAELRSARGRRGGGRGAVREHPACAVGRGPQEVQQWCPCAAQRT